MLVGVGGFSRNIQRFLSESVLLKIRLLLYWKHVAVSRGGLG